MPCYRAGGGNVYSKYLSTCTYGGAGMSCMASCCSGITAMHLATRLQADPLLAPAFTPAVSLPSLPSYLQTLTVLSPSHTGVGGAGLALELVVSLLSSPRPSQS